MARRKLATKTWADYDIGDPSQANQQELSIAVRRAAKAANQRLLRFERAGHTKGMYANAMYDLVNRKRFKERTDKMSLNALRHEYKILRSFLSAKTSTLQGRQDTIMKRYHKAQEKGFQGLLDDFEFQVEKYFAENVEALFSSHTIYTAITEGKTDIIDETMDRIDAKKADKNTQKGAALLYYMRRKESQKRE